MKNRDKPCDRVDANLQNRMATPHLHSIGQSPVFSTSPAQQLELWKWGTRQVLAICRERTFLESIEPRPHLRGQYKYSHDGNLGRSATLLGLPWCACLKFLSKCPKNRAGHFPWTGRSQPTPCTEANLLKTLWCCHADKTSAWLFTLRRN